MERPCTSSRQLVEHLPNGALVQFCILAGDCVCALALCVQKPSQFLFFALTFQKNAAVCRHGRGGPLRW